jgi:hypothetical protein
MPSPEPPPLALFGAFILLFLFPPGAPRRGGDRRFVYVAGLLFIVGALASAVPRLDALARMSLGTCMLLAYARTWIRLGSERLWLSRVVGAAVVLFPLAQWPNETLWIAMALLCIQQAWGCWRQGLAIAAAIVFLWLSPPWIAAAGAVGIAVVLIRRYS